VPNPSDDSEATEPVRPFEVLIVDDEPDICELLGDVFRGQPVIVHTAANLDEARVIALQKSLDLVLVDVKLPDGDGTEFAEELRQRDPAIQSIVMTGKPSVKRAQQAMRSGASDFLSKPLDLDELNTCVDRALRRRADGTKNSDKVRRLRHLCRKLNRARHEVTQQVDILCNDLVTAYQELAGQMKHVQVTSGFKAILDQELDLEQVLRRVLEFVLQQVGSTNAVIFLPSVGGGFTTGGYINFSFDKEAADMLLSHLADVAAPKIAEAEHVIHFEDNDAISGWLADDSAYLEDSHVVGLSCRHDRRPMASLMLFRDANEPFDAEAIETLSTIGPILAAHLSKVIGIHHRLAEHMDAEDKEGGLPF
jgi:DNA-binding response OmpR family regulator